MARFSAVALIVLLSALPASAQTVLLDFSSPFCGPCQQLEPTIDRLAREGFPVRKIDVTRDAQMKARYRVTRVPCLVMVHEGREVKRLLGGADYPSLRSMLAHYTAKPPASQRPSLPVGAWGGGGQPTPPTTPAAPAHVNPTGFESKLLSSSVRLKVEDAHGFGYGTGTIVDTWGQDALIVTCGHLFRDSAGKGRITVEIFNQTPRGPVVAERIAGQLIAFDDQRDVGLVSINPKSQVAVSPIAPQPTLNENDRVWSVGCNHGDDPTIMASRVTGVQHDHVNAAYRPVEGRSGGGLFNEQGQLVGVCTGAYQETDEGLYANLRSIYAELDRANLSAVYQPNSERSAGVEQIAEAPPAATAAVELTPVPLIHNPAIPTTLAENERTSSALDVSPAVGLESSLAPIEQAALEEIAARAVASEVVVIVRPKDTSGRSEVLTLDHVSPQFVEQLRRLRTASGDRLAAQP